MRARCQDQLLKSRVGSTFRSNGSTLSPQTSPIPSQQSPPRMAHKMSQDAVGDLSIRPLQRFHHDRLPPAHQHRVVAMVEYPDGMLTFHELAEVSDGDAVAEEALMAIVDEQGKTVRYRTIAKQFEDTVNWFVAYGSTEVWSILNLTEDTHPFHVHLVQFQELRRDLYNKDGFHPATGATTAPISFQGHGTLDANQLGWKDTSNMVRKQRKMSNKKFK